MTITRMSTSFVIKAVKEALSRIEVGGNKIPYKDLQTDRLAGTIDDIRNEREHNTILYANAEIQGATLPVKLTLSSNTLTASEMISLTIEIQDILKQSVEIVLD